MDRRFQFDPFSPEAAAFDTGGPSLDGIDWSDPSSFFRFMQASGSALPIPKISSPSEIRTEAQRRSANIFRDYDTLRQIVERHELTIQRRWAKKGNKQRLAILTDAWGSKMATMHRPDFTAFKKETPQQRQRGTRFRDAFIWPYINEEDLCVAKTLPLLLNSRGRNPPSSFAAADGGEMHIGWVTQAVMPVFLNEWTMILNGVTTQDEYGKLLSWDEHEDAFDWYATRKQFMPGEGLMVLEAQERLMTFLVKCCRKILHDIPDADLTDDTKFPVLPEPERKSEIELNGLVFQSLAVLAAEAPYRVPANLDLERVESLLAARLSDAEDHLWALREDPSYLVDTLVVQREHRQEQVLDQKGMKHPLVTKQYTERLWGRCVASMLTVAINELETLSELHQQARNLRTLQTKYSGDISPTKDLPPEYLYALLNFRYFLLRMAKGPQKRLSQSFPASPPVRHYWRRLSGNDMFRTELRGVPNPMKTKEDKARDDLQQTLTIIWQDDKDLFLLKLTRVVDELNRLIVTEPKVKEQVSAFIAHIIGSLSVITECVRQLDIYQPWANNFENAAVDLQDKIDQEWNVFFEHLKPMLAAVQFGDFDDKKLSKAINFGDITDGRFAYPVEKRRTRENVETLRRAEANLDAFWAVLDRHMHTHVRNLKGTALGRFLSQNRALHRTAEWVEPPPEAKGVSTGTQAPDPDLDALNKPLSAFFFDRFGDKDKSDFTPARAKTKVKTKGTPSVPVAAPTPAQDDGANPTDPQPVMAVDARALKVFRMLFFNPATTSTAGEVAWSDFLYALTSTGFRAEKLYGSIWQFTPTRLDVERPIQIHEPHPGSKIPFVVARRHGRRLNRAYGWFGGMFVLADQSDGKQS